MKTINWLKLSKAEIKHILSLIEVNERDGWYYSPKGQYWDRSNKIKRKLKDMLNQKLKKQLFDDIGVGGYDGGDFYKD